jgi:hypothetical protein
MIIYNMFKIDTLYIILFLIIIYFVFIHKLEGIENIPQTIFGVRNPFTGLRCYDNNLPIVSVDSNTFTCISKDGINCLTRDDLKIPNENIYDSNGKIISNKILCRNKEDKNNNVNTYLSKDGIRQLAGGPYNPNTRDIFNDLDANGYYTIECTPAGLNSENHWCNKLYNNVEEMCNGMKDQFEKRNYTECGDTLATFKNSPIVPNMPNVNATLFKRPVQPSVSKSTTPDAYTINMCKNKTCIRGRPPGMSLATCQTNCNKCGDSKC